MVSCHNRHFIRKGNCHRSLSMSDWQAERKMFRIQRKSQQKTSQIVGLWVDKCFCWQTQNANRWTAWIHLQLMSAWRSKVLIWRARAESPDTPRPFMISQKEVPPIGGGVRNATSLIQQRLSYIDPNTCYHFSENVHALPLTTITIRHQPFCNA